MQQRLCDNHHVNMLCTDIGNNSGKQLSIFANTASYTVKLLPSSLKARQVDHDHSPSHHDASKQKRQAATRHMRAAQPNKGMR